MLLVDALGQYRCRQHPPQTAALVGQAPDIMFASPHPASQAVHDLTGTIPIVVVQSGDLVGAGFARADSGFARECGNSLRTTPVI